MDYKPAQTNLEALESAVRVPAWLRTRHCSSRFSECKYPEVAAAGGWHGELEAGSWAWAPGPLVPLSGLPDVEPRPPSLERPRNTHQTSPGPIYVLLLRDLLLLLLSRFSRVRLCATP